MDPRSLDIDDITIDDDVSWTWAPPPDTTDPAAAEHAAAPRRRSATAEAPPTVSPWRRAGTPGRRKRVRRFAGLLAAAAVIGVGAVVIATLPDVHTPSSDNPLEEMAQLAVNPEVQAEPQPDRPVLHVIAEVTRTGRDQPGGAGQAETWHAWRRADGSGREDRGGQRRTIDPAFGIIPPDAPVVEHSDPGGGTSRRAPDAGTTGSLDATIGGYPINQSLIDDLPRDPSALRSRLADLVSGRAEDGTMTAANPAPSAGGDPSANGDPSPAGPDVASSTVTGRDALVFRAATDLLVSWLAPPALRSAALEVVGNIRGVTVRKGSDPRGRGAIVATLVHDGRSEVYLDPSTSALMGHRVIDPDGTVIDELEILAADWVATVPES